VGPSYSLPPSRPLGTKLMTGCSRCISSNACCLLFTLVRLPPCCAIAISACAEDDSEAMRGLVFFGWPHHLRLVHCGFFQSIYTVCRFQLEPFFFTISTQHPIATLKRHSQFIFPYFLIALSSNPCAKRPNDNLHISKPAHKRSFSSTILFESSLLISRSSLSTTPSLTLLRLQFSIMGRGGYN
jgi:hypothetical protein